jgi:NNP family nitrate/nitrite transporter-like MFS transporter
MIPVRAARTGNQLREALLAALFAPMLAIAFGWQNVIGLAAIPLVMTLAVFIFAAKDSPNTPAPKKLAVYFALLKVGDCWWFMFFYSVTFCGFVGLASSLTIYFNDTYGLSPVVAGYCTAAIVFVGSLVRPMGGAVADRVGGVRALVVLYAIAACAFATIPQACPPSIWRCRSSWSVCSHSAWATDRCSSSCRSASSGKSGP